MTAYLRHCLISIPQRSAFIVRLMSSTVGNYTELTREKDYSILVMKHLPANALTTEFMLEMKERIQAVENSESHGLVITSAARNIFSSGLDLNELVGSGRSTGCSKLYNLFQELWFTIYKSRLVTIAAMNGHAIAAGCGLALACDYRVLAEGTHGFGIPSALLGIPMPNYFLDAIQKVTSWHKGNVTALQARIFKPEEALSIGLVDQVVSKDDVLVAAEEEMATFLRTNHRARVVSKMDARNDLISRFEDLRQKDMKKLVGAIQNPETMAILVKQIESIKRSKKSS